MPATPFVEPSFKDGFSRLEFFQLFNQCSYLPAKGDSFDNIAYLFFHGFNFTFKVFVLAGCFPQFFHILLMQLPGQHANSMQAEYIISQPFYDICLHFVLAQSFCYALLYTWPWLSGRGRWFRVLPLTA